MSTALAIAIYATYAAHRWWNARTDRERAKAEEAVREATAKHIELRMTAIEDALKASPFVTWTKN